MANPNKSKTIFGSSKNEKIYCGKDVRCKASRILTYITYKDIFKDIFKATILCSFVVLITLIKMTITAAIAHEVKTSQEIGGTIHIEPNDRPIAGKKSTIWVALTKRGGEIIPYSKCNCRMEVRSLSDRDIKFTVANPLAVIEGYLGLPSLRVTFPQVGRYELKLIGSARSDEDFQPFELTFTTNVGK